jgi:hypothetical protein
VEPWEIIKETLGYGEAVKLAKATGKDHDLFSSYGRPPRCPEHPTQSGNYSPVFYYLQFFAQRHGVNSLGAIKMHSLVNKEVEDFLGETVTTDVPLPDLVIDIIEKATETLKKVNVGDIEDAKKNELMLIDGLLVELQAQVQDAHSRVRAERKRRECTLKQVGAR